MPVLGWLTIPLGLVYCAVHFCGVMGAARLEHARFGAPPYRAAVPKSLIVLRWLGLVLLPAGLMPNVLGAPRSVSTLVFLNAGAVGSVVIIAVALWARRIERNWAAAQ